MASTTATRPNLSDLEDEVTVETIPMSYEAYLTWAEGDERGRRRGEWVDGEVIPFMSTSERHGRIITFLIRLLGEYLDLRRPGRIYSQGLEFRTHSASAREPDILVVFEEHFARIEEMRLVGPADLVIEVISTDSVTRDRRVKHDEYESTGVPEYWLIDPREGKERIDIFVLGARGRYASARQDDEGRIWSAQLPGVWADPSWLVVERVPNVIRLAMQMAGVTELPE